MSNIRLIGQSVGGLSRNVRTGDTLISTLNLSSVATDSALTLTVPQVAGGVIQYTGFTAGRNLTTPTAADIIAAFPNLDIGESIELRVSITVAYAGTWVAGTGVTLAGRATVPASTMQLVLITKTSATTVTWTAV